MIKTLCFFILGLLVQNGLGQMVISPVDLPKIESDEVVPELELNQGLVKGKRYSDLGVEIFTGIPYAQYKGRWQHSELLDQFPGKIFDGTSPSVKCAQPVGPFNGGDELIENCLTLDIYRPIGNDKGEILFWIHGGAFMYGDAASYSGIEQASVYGNTVVVIQYRLGFLGFMNYQDEQGQTVGGNFGLKDQLIALKFIYQNKHQLGCSRITINGESAGGASVSLLLLHDEAIPLVDGGIAQSGGLLAGFMDSSARKDQNANIKTICAAVEGCDHSKSTSLQIQYLSSDSVDFNTIVDANVKSMLQWAPIPYDGIFYKTNALDKFKSKNLNLNIPLIIGSNSYEGSIVHMLGKMYSGQEQILDQMGTITLAKDGLKLYNDVDSDFTSTWDEFTETSLNQFQDIERFEELSDDHYRFIIEQIIGDVIFKYPAWLDAKIFSNVGADVYLYHLDLDGRGDWLVNGTTCCGLGHGKELLYSFGVTKSETNMLAFTGGFNSKPDQWESKATKFFGEELSSFIKTGGLSNENAPKFQSGKYIKVENTDVEVSFSLKDDNKDSSYRQQKSKYAIQYWKNLPSRAADSKDEL